MLGDLFGVQWQELEGIAFGWGVNQLLAAFAPSPRDDLDPTDKQIASFLAGFLKRILEHLPARIMRTASIGLLKTS